MPGGCRSAFSFLLFQVTGFAVAFGSIALQRSLTWRKLRSHINLGFGSRNRFQARKGVGQCRTLQGFTVGQRDAGMAAS